MYLLERENTRLFTTCTHTRIHVIEAVRFISASYPDNDTLPVVFVGLRMSNLSPASEQIMPLVDDQLHSRVSALEIHLQLKMKLY